MSPNCEKYSVGVVHLGGPGVGVNREELRPHGLVNVQAIQVEVLELRVTTGHTVNGLDLASGAANDPVQNAGVVAVAGPHEVAVFALRTS